MTAKQLEQLSIAEHLDMHMLRQFPGLAYKQAILSMLSPRQQRRIDTAMRVDLGLNGDGYGQIYQRALSAIIEEIQSNSK